MNQKEWGIVAPGHVVTHVLAESEKQARQFARFELGIEKLPKDTTVRTDTVYMNMENY